MLPVECVVRGYITGSGWKDYQATGAVSGIELPDGLRESEQLPEPIFTPSTKAEVGATTRRSTSTAPAELVGDRELLERAARRVDRGLRAGRRPRARARHHPRRHEVRVRPRPRRHARCSATRCCTPDSSRFWPADEYEPGRGQPSFDKQYVRDWAAGIGLGQDPARAGDPRRRGRAHARALRGRPTSGSRASRSRAWLERVGVRARVLIRPKAGILDPQGQAVERALPALGFEGVAQRARRPAGRARRGGRRRRCRRCASSCWPTR